MLLAAAGALYEWQQATSDRKLFAPPGNVFQAGDVALHIDCRGRGSPTVILEAGLGLDSTGWHKVHDALSLRTRTCAYDRAGRGWSSPGDEPINSTLVADRLHILLQAAAEGPIVLVGMSAGGIFVRKYYDLYPENVVGMVLVDSSHEEQQARLPSLEDAPDTGLLLNLCTWLQPIGVIRAFSILDEFVTTSETPTELLPVLFANAYQTHSCKSVLLESSGFKEELATQRLPTSLGDLPLLVLSQGKPPEANEESGMSKEFAIAMRDAWNEMQLELTGLSSRGKRAIASESGHLIQIDQPELVIEGITGMITELRLQ